MVKEELDIRRGLEGESTMNPSYCIRNTDNAQNLFRATPILFGATHVEFRTSQSVKKCVMLHNTFIPELKNKTQKNVNIHNNTNIIDNFNPIILMKGEFLFVSC